MFKVNLDFVAVGGNGYPAASDWDPSSGLLAFGADNNIALWDPRAQVGIAAILVGHPDKVTALRFLLSKTRRAYLISGSVDGSVRVWSFADASTLNGRLSTLAVLSSHSKSVNAICVETTSHLFATASADRTVRIWQINPSCQDDVAVTLLSTVSLEPSFIPLSLTLSCLKGHASPLLLAVAGTKQFVQIYVANSPRNPHFSLRATLTGHEGWIQALAVTRETEDANSDILLASASQDKYIRLWRIHQGYELSSVNTPATDPSLGSFARTLSNKLHRFKADELDYTVTFEALLLGHEDWIYSAAWRPRQGKLQLLSASADNSLAFWEPDETSGVWICVTRLGEISGQKGSTTATGSTGGFWNALWSSDGQTVLSLGRTGGWRVWRYDAEQSRWQQGVATSGHLKEVTGLAWGSNGQYLLSTGSDQTTRLWADWTRGKKRSWHEFSRPQIHGYDLNCIDTLGPTQFISGADEKLLRVFDEPRTVANNLDKLCGIQSAEQEKMPDTANIPALGLSNKAIQGVETDEDADTMIATSASLFSVEDEYPPLEDQLARFTLWPEREKLYGHGYEISAVAASHDCSLVATACRASSIDHAVIRLYDTKEWREVKPSLKAHALTVTRIRFSPDDQFILSVGRDRQWALFKRKAGLSQTYDSVVLNPKAHSRMILDASWSSATSHVLRKVFATAGRDKAVKVWTLNVSELNVNPIATITTDAPVTAIDFLPLLVGNSLIIAIGTETGAMQLGKIDCDSSKIVAVQSIDPSIGPSRSITQLSWRTQHESLLEKAHGRDATDAEVPRSGGDQLAVASQDSSVRIYSFESVL
ncbi:MAG: hypothetical protein M1817_006559 [Caeruleum heppii]|nr:MAG: hypothetical protein M1817_006559 [Caeruleum heppii]